ncbi:alpha/beta hydrolase family protein [Acinetobacter larvae]|uniref:Hydrolase n=1 Tax=Acinetobacter larvae TaxID=1789224 RepID=A0A1B2LWX1_9GAMM|nr:hypothetical protein [Acinetobacter larvae]AOA57435.1 hypothetical protein BFG52_03075 [Acinetobacter larvae]
MQRKILIYTGWGVGTAVLQPLAQQLQQHGYLVKLKDIFAAQDTAILQAELEDAQHYDVLLGWSLGGNLAVLLADQLYQRLQQTKVVITIASNPCFVQRAHWQHAMPVELFQSFQQLWQQDSAQCLKRFYYLMSQGSATQRTAWRSLQDLAQPAEHRLLSQGLILLDELNLVDILKKYPAPSYHVFAKQDALIPCEVFGYFQNLSTKFLNCAEIEGSHACPVFASEEISCMLVRFLKENYI